MPFADITSLLTPLAGSMPRGGERLEDGKMPETALFAVEFDEIAVPEAVVFGPDQLPKTPQPRDQVSTLPMVATVKGAEDQTAGVTDLWRGPDVDATPFVGEIPPDAVVRPSGSVDLNSPLQTVMETGTDDDRGHSLEERTTLTALPTAPVVHEVQSPEKVPVIHGPIRVHDIPLTDVPPAQSSGTKPTVPNPSGPGVSALPSAEIMTHPVPATGTAPMSHQAPPLPYLSDAPPHVLDSAQSRDAPPTRSPQPTREEPQMQLIKPNRLRPFPPGLIAAQIAQSDGETAPQEPARVTQSASFVPPPSPRERIDPPVPPHAQQAAPEQPVMYELSPHKAAVPSIWSPVPSSDASSRPVTQAPTAQVSPGTTPLATNPYAALTMGPNAPLPATLVEDRVVVEAKAVDGSGILLRDTAPSPPPTARTPDVTVPLRSEQVVHQIIQIAQTPGMHRHDVQLNPEELGRVRMSLQSAEQVMHVMITVERPETLDLMRRHIDQLFQQFRGMGYQDVTFSFSQDGRMARDSARNDPSQEADPESDVAQPPPPQTQHPPAGQLDLRV